MARNTAVPGNHMSESTAAVDRAMTEADRRPDDYQQPSPTDDHRPERAGLGAKRQSNTELTGRLRHEVP